MTRRQKSPTLPENWNTRTCTLPRKRQTRSRIGNGELDVAELHIADEDEAETLASEPPAEESPEAAAQRIDAWFRSAKTLPDVPPLEDESRLSRPRLITARITKLNRRVRPPTTPRST